MTAREPNALRPSLGDRWWWIGAGIVSLLSFGFTSGFEGSSSWIFFPWFVSLLVWGLPHGADDHEVVLRLWNRPRTWRPMAIIVLVYAGTVLAGILLWRIAPRLQFLIFIAVTLLHWGTADLWWSWRRDPAALPTVGRRVLFALWRGALPMLLPLAAYPEIYRRTAQSACGVFGAATDFSWLMDPRVRIAAAAVCTLLGAADWFRAVPSATRWLNRAESAVLAVGFLALNPVVSIGLYFTCWHGLRHVLRLTASQPGAVNRRLLTFAGRSAAMTAISLIGLLAVWLWSESTADAFGKFGVYLILIASLTSPHAVVVIWMDLADGLWTAGHSPPTPGTLVDQ